jgi:hypothetical protein
MQTTPPYGYDEIVPLRKEHRVRFSEDATPAFARKLNALAISLAEFTAAARDYPVVFASLDQGRSFAPLIVLGLEQGVNLFVGPGGDWERGAYYPAFVRRYPFCISKLYVDGRAQSERVVCVARSQLDDAGIALFDAAGNPSPRWAALERLLADYEADLDRTAQMCAALARFQLFEPFTMQHGEINLAGVHWVSEAKLRDLKAATLKLLVNKGHMGAIYAHLHSLQNFSRLVDRRAAGRG